MRIPAIHIECLNTILRQNAYMHGQITKGFGIMNTCISRFGIHIGDRKYLNEYTHFGSVSLWNSLTVRRHWRVFNGNYIPPRLRENLHVWGHLIRINDGQSRFDEQHGCREHYGVGVGELHGVNPDPSRLQVLSHPLYTLLVCTLKEENTGVIIVQFSGQRYSSCRAKLPINPRFVWFWLSCNWV